MMIRVGFRTSATARATRRAAEHPPAPPRPLCPIEAKAVKGFPPFPAGHCIVARFPSLPGVSTVVLPLPHLLDD